ncbi:transcriptional accessory protein [Halobacteroides halobius DSM 5150]|uniref:Transcriptional accessory protein n=1 Tax=Halobacteroides halobius (strain ATCC 35273 / DSM 5150 / MD-1) TaxID=748449 RepID=L0K7P1_HALHC|nr:Tex family protein [Halobacteroides halobius]AGB40143.1 transcriptional accessory protein [Halobacteroides halobius DSM 5150]
MNFNIVKQLATDLNLAIGQVKKTIKLLDEGNTIPFIARYRKEATGRLTEDKLRELEERLDYLRRLQAKKKKVITAITEQGKLTVQLKEEINAATSLQDVKDLYRPYKQRQKTRAAKAKEKGLEPLADLFLAQDITTGSVVERCQEFIDPKQELEDIASILQGVKDIIAQHVADQPKSRKLAREITFDKGKLVVKGKVDEITEYQTYYEFEEEIGKLAPYQILAINRGEHEDILKVKVVTLKEQIINNLKAEFITDKSIFKEVLEEAIDDAYHRLLAPAIAREVRSYLKEEAEEHAIDVFAKNLRNLLMQPPLIDKKVLAIDPAFRTGCKIAVLDKAGQLLKTTNIYPHEPQNKWQVAKEKLIDLITAYNLDVVAIGNGTACRETETLVSEVIAESLPKLRYVIVNEDGASVYSASPLAREEFPKLDVSLRGAISIGRRLQDPLAELVKINPKHLGVGLYQHDLNQSNLEEALEKVVESVVNYVGVDLNTASSALLEHIAGITSAVADKIVSYRHDKGEFTTRQELKNVYGIGPNRFTQAAGFLRIKAGDNPLDQTAIHPESYQVAQKLLAKIGFNASDLFNQEQRLELREKIKQVDLNDFVSQLEVGLATLQDIKEALLKPGRDPREEVSQSIFKRSILKLEDLEIGMILTGKVSNVVDFGAFVDIGVKEDGLVHISELSSDFVKDPLEVVAVGQTVKVKVLEINQVKGQISLTMVL